MAAISTIIMAGGLGTRMRSPLPKVLHELCGLPMLAWVVRAARAAGADDVVVVAGPETADAIAAALPDVPRRGAVPRQRHRRCGAGRASRRVPADGGARRRPVGRHAADRARDRARARSRPAAGGVGGALVSARLAPPHAYGRVVRDGERVARIVEARDAERRGARARRVQRRALLLPRATRWRPRCRGSTPHNAQGELLPDRRGRAARRRRRGRRGRRAGARDGRGRQHAGRAGRARGRPARAHPARATCWRACASSTRATTYVDGGVRLEPGCRIEPHVMLRGATAVGADSVIGPYAMIDDGADRRGLPGRAVRLPAPRLHAGRRRAGRALRRAQEHRRSASAPRCRT